MKKNASNNMKWSRRKALRLGSNLGGMALFSPILRSIRGEAAESQQAKILFYAGPGIATIQQADDVSALFADSAFYKLENGSMAALGASNNAKVNFFMPQRISDPNVFPEGVFTLDSDIKLPYVLSPLQRVLADVNIISGVSYGDLSAEYTHHSGFAVKMTAAPGHADHLDQFDYRATGESLDFFIASSYSKKLINAGYAYLYGEPWAPGASLSYGDGYFCSFRNENGVIKANQPFNAPSDLWQNLFADYVGVTPEEIQANLEKKQLLNANVMDFWKQDLIDLKAEMSKSEFAHFQEYLDLIEQVSNNANQQLSSDINLNICPPDIPDLITSIPFLNGGYQLTDETFANQYFDQQIDITLAALACHISHSGVICFDGSHGSLGLPFLGFPANGFHNMNHGSLEKTLLAMHQFYTEKFVRILEKSKEISMPGGKTLFDDLILHWAGELGDIGQHQVDNLPILIGGGGAGYLKTGQLISYPFQNNKLHGSILTNIKEAAGLGDGNAYGASSYTGAALSEIKKNV